MSSALLTRKPLLLSLTLSVLITGLLWGVAFHFLVEGKRSVYLNQAVTVKNALIKQISISETAARGYQAFFTASNHVSEQEFRTYTLTAINQYDFIRHAFYSKLVQHENRSLYESENSTADRSPATIFHVDASGQRSPAPRQDIYYPIVYAEPVEEIWFKHAQGLDQLWLLNNTNVERAGEGNIQASAPIKLPSGDLAFFMLAPILNPDQSSSGRSPIVGLVSLEISPVVLLQSIELPDDFSATLDIADFEGASPQLRNTQWAHKGAASEEASRSIDLTSWHVHYRLEINNRDFNLLIERPLSIKFSEVLLLVFCMAISFLISIGLWFLIKSRLESAREKASNQSKSEFLAVMSHEIRTPLNGVLGMAELLSTTALEKNQRHYIDVIISSGKSLLHVINDILDYSKIEAGRMELEEIDFSIEQMVAELADIYRYTSFRKGLCFAASMDPDTPTYLHGDPTRFRQVLLNLLSNAFKFTEEGEVELRVDCLLLENNRCQLKVTIRDTGIGISSRQQQNLFNAFTQLDLNINRKYGGTGLGLSICHRLVTLMDGKLGVESELGQGSRFWATVEFPIGEGNKPMPVKLKDKSVLIVDDYPTALRIMDEQASALGLNVVTASSVEEAWKILDDDSKTMTFDFIITDLDMPTTNGLEFSKQLSTRSEYDDVPVLLLTASSDIPSHRAQLLAKLDYAGSKPASVYQMAMALTKADPTSQNEEPEIVSEISFETGSRLNILVAEDNPVNAQVISGMLRKLGHTLTLSNDGEEAVAIYASNHSIFDVILMDCEMPIVDGFQATLAIRDYEREHDLEAKPIIALTAHALAEFQKRSVDAGMDGYLTKPLSINELTTALTRYRHKKLSEALDDH